MPEEAVLNESGGITDLSEAIGKLMEHPEILSMAASVLGQKPSAGASMEDMPVDEAAPTRETASDPSSEAVKASAEAPDLMQMLGPMLSKSHGSEHKESKHGIERSTALLIALKPYLSPSRCEQIDRLVELSKLGSILEHLR